MPGKVAQIKTDGPAPVDRLIVRGEAYHHVLFALRGGKSRAPDSENAQYCIGQSAVHLYRNRVVVALARDPVSHTVKAVYERWVPLAPARCIEFDLMGCSWHLTVIFS